jgi:hypothetical protein
VTETTRVRVCVQTGELEVQGTEKFVAEYGDAIAALLDRMATTPVPVALVGNGNGKPSEPSVTASGGTMDLLSFPEALHGLPKNATGSDQILLAGSFAARSNPEKTFATSDASALLVEQGIKLSNPSQALKNNLAGKKVFKVGSRYRVSKTGEDHLKNLNPRL